MQQISCHVLCQRGLFYTRESIQFGHLKLDPIEPTVVVGADLHPIISSRLHFETPRCPLGQKRSTTSSIRFECGGHPMVAIFSPVYGSEVSVPRQQLCTTNCARPATLTARHGRSNAGVTRATKYFPRGNLISFTECRRRIRLCATGLWSPGGNLQLGWKR